MAKFDGLMPQGRSGAALSHVCWGALLSAWFTAADTGFSRGARRGAEIVEFHQEFGQAFEQERHADFNSLRLGGVHHPRGHLCDEASGRNPLRFHQQPVLRA